MENENFFPILIYGNECLRKECKILKKKNIDKNLIQKMFDTMYNAKGVGLAAPQIGINIQMFVADISFYLKKKKNNGKMVCINPSIEYPQDDNALISGEEGCLSIPGLHYNVYRYNKIIIKYYDENFNYYEEKYEGWASRILQHETDHLFKRLYVDYVPYFLVKNNLIKILKGKFKCDYKILY